MALTSRHPSSGTPRPTDPTSPADHTSPAGAAPGGEHPASPSAAETNDAIRALVDSRAGRDWSCEAYEVLLVEWAAASRGPVPDMVEAA
ncbi:hypothetical protein [Streptomyces sp. NPDC008125]|uniref:hypothetical protein n=1 Tax=Streptomyces sp. NPDC008125 TaxID=3364811 RepID=UPI0036E272BC